MAFFLDMSVISILSPCPHSTCISMLALQVLPHLCYPI